MHVWEAVVFVGFISLSWTKEQTSYNDCDPKFGNGMCVSQSVNESSVHQDPKPLARRKRSDADGMKVKRYITAYGQLSRPSKEKAQARCLSSTTWDHSGISVKVSNSQCSDLLAKLGQTPDANGVHSQHIPIQGFSGCANLELFYLKVNQDRVQWQFICGGEFGPPATVKHKPAGEAVSPHADSSKKGLFGIEMKGPRWILPVIFGLAAALTIVGVAFLLVVCVIYPVKSKEASGESPAGSSAFANSSSYDGSAASRNTPAESGRPPTEIDSTTTGDGTKKTTFRSPSRKTKSTSRVHVSDESEEQYITIPSYIQ